MEIAYPCGELTTKHGIMSGGVKRARDMEILQQRFQAELVAVRGLLRKAAAVRLPSAQRVKESRPVLLAEEPPAKKRKASPPPVPVLKNKKLPTKKMTGSEREMLAEDLESLVAEIPDHIVELLKKQSCATHPGEIEIDLHALDDAAVLELQEHVDKFARDKRAASPSPQERHQTDGPKVMAQEEKEEEYVDICGGVSPLAIVPAPPLQLVEDEATSGSPSSSSGDSDSDDSSGSDSDSEDEEVDICGGVSPLAILPAPLPPLVGEETNSGSPGSSSGGDSDTDDSSSSSDSDDSEHSGNSSDSDSDSDEIVDSPAPAIIRPPTCEQVARALERQRKEATSRAREKARQEVLHTERTAMPDDTLHLEDVKRLGIDEYNTAKPNNLLRQIGLYLKVDDHDDDWKQQQLQHQSFQEDLEEGEIRS